MPMKKKELTGGRHRATLAGVPLEDTDTVGRRAGTMTRTGSAIEKILGNDLRAYTPQEAQQAQSSVDAETMRRQSSRAAGAAPLPERDDEPTEGKGYLPKYKTGGIVQKTGPAIVHKGELIIPREEVGAECCGVVSSGGWVVNPKNAGQYTGENAPWRR